MLDIYFLIIYISIFPYLREADTSNSNVNETHVSRVPVDDLRLSGFAGRE